MPMLYKVTNLCIRKLYFIDNFYIITEFYNVYYINIEKKIIVICDFIHVISFYLLQFLFIFYHKNYMEINFKIAFRTRMGFIEQSNFIM